MILIIIIIIIQISFYFLVDIKFSYDEFGLHKKTPVDNIQHLK